MRKVINNIKLETLITIIGSLIFIPMWIFTIIGLINEYVI
tara:strand:+ start:612 stop:731 length:120 start_codon:yes stop_codon:yes gene_type:complete